MAKEVKVLVACGSGVATSTIAQEEIKDIAKEAGVKTVSYTHLDVYKRQEFYFSPRKEENSFRMPKKSWRLQRGQSRRRNIFIRGIQGISGLHTQDQCRQTIFQIF